MKTKKTDHDERLSGLEKKAKIKKLQIYYTTNDPFPVLVDWDDANQSFGWVETVLQWQERHIAAAKDAAGDEEFFACQFCMFVPGEDSIPALWKSFKGKVASGEISSADYSSNVNRARAFCEEHGYRLPTNLLNVSRIEETALEDGSFEYQVIFK